MTLLLLGPGPARADLMPPSSSGFVAEEPGPPRLPPHPLPVAEGTLLLGLLLVGGVLVARALRRRRSSEGGP